MAEFKSFYKTVAGGEGSKCKYPTRLDTYGCGCSHDCGYCYAKSLLDFRGLWNPEEPRIADLRAIERRLDKVPSGAVLRLGGMTDCFQAQEEASGVTRETLRMMFERGIHALIVTKSDLIARDDYLDVLDRGLAHVQVSVTTTDDATNPFGEKAPAPSRRIAAIERLHAEGVDVAVRLSPLVPEFVDFDRINAIKVNKAQVEFLRVNSWIAKWLSGVDLSAYTLKEGGYRHLPLERKLEVLGRVKLPNVSVCEDVQEHYDYWRSCYNPNGEDCCNLSISKGGGDQACQKEDEEYRSRSQARSWASRGQR